MNLKEKQWISISAAIAGGLTASACCILPLILISVGISGAWISNLTALAVYQGWILLVSGVMLALSFYFIFYSSRNACDDGSTCAKPKSRALVKFSFYLATLLILLATFFPYLIQYFE